MRYFSVLALIAQAATALTITDGSISVGSQRTEFNPSSPFLLTADDTITVRFSLPDPIPEQVTVLLGNGKGLETSYFPVISGTSARLVVPAARIPAALRAENRLVLNLVVASPASEVFDDSDDEWYAEEAESVFLTIGELHPELGLGAGYQPAERFAAQPEIIHQFRQGAQTTNASIAVVFVVLIGVLFLGLLGAWTATGVVNFKALPKGAGAFYHVVFLGTIAGFEVVFFKYYVASTVFETIARVAVLSVPAVYSGSKVLRGLARG